MYLDGAQGSLTPNLSKEQLNGVPECSPKEQWLPLGALSAEKHSTEHPVSRNYLFPSAPQNLGTEQLPAPGLLSFLSQIQSPDLQPA